MNWDDLRIFLAVARTGTLAAAGQRLMMDPTTVARRVARLEQRIEHTLFEHTPAGHVLTARGTELLEHAQAMESAAIASIERRGSEAYPGGTIRVSVSEGFGGWIVAPNLHEFAERYPGMAIELVAATGFLNPSRREADIAIMLARPKSGPLVVRKLTDYRLGLYARRGVPLPDLNGVGDLPDHRLVGYVPDLIYAPELRYLDHVGDGLTASLASTSVNAQAMMIRAGAGIGILPCFIGGSDPALVRVLRDDIDIRGAFWLVIHRDLRGVARVKMFVDWLDDLISRMRPVIDGADAA